MESKRQTAVDYFFDKIKSNFEHDGDKLESVTFLYAICKEKEREQIVSAVHYGIRSPYTNIQTIHTQIEMTKGEQYYNDTYGTEPSR